jgi:hypothetical protein
MTKSAAVAMVLIVLILIAALASGRVIIPGALLLIWVTSETRPYRSVVVTTLPSGRPKLQLGTDLLTLSRRDHQILVAAATTARNQLNQATAHPGVPTYNPAPNIAG